MPATLITLAKLTAVPGVSLAGEPFGNLIVDSEGDFFGTAKDAAETPSGIEDALFKVAAGSSTATNVTVFPDTGLNLVDATGLVTDANGDLFGTTTSGGVDNSGTVFEISKSGGNYAPSATTVVSFSGSDGSFPFGSLFVDSDGNLFGTTQTGSGAGVDGTIFEIKKNGSSYEPTPITLADLAEVGGTAAEESLIADANGDLIGTTEPTGGLALGPGPTIFELKKMGGGYATTPITLANFSVVVGHIGNLVADANGDLFGITSQDAVFEIVKTPGTPTGYASAPTILTTLPTEDGSTTNFNTSLTVDANGDLFGTTSGGPHGLGTVFEIVKAANGYEKTPKLVITFSSVTGGGPPQTTLLPDAEGDLLGETSGGAVFKITDSGFVTGTAPGVPSDLVFQNADGQAAIWGLTGANLSDGGTVNSNPGPGWKAAATGDFNADGHNDILWQNANGQAAIWDMNGNNIIGGGSIFPNLGPSWKAVGTGDFNDDLHSDIVWQNADGQVAVWEMKDTNMIGGGAVIPNPGATWKAVGTGDFNGDGDSDIIFQNTDGQADIWEMNGNLLIGGGAVSPNPGPSWKLVGSGDFNNDGHSDLLWQNSGTSQVAIWEMNGNNLIGGGTVSTNPGPSWHAIGTGSEGSSSDILFQNTSGQTAIWDMSGTNIVGGGAVGANPGGSWKAVGLGL
jgi:hypothetical protein